MASATLILDVLDVQGSVFVGFDTYLAVRDWLLQNAPYMVEFRLGDGGIEIVADLG